MINKNIIIYGAGMLGKHLYNFLMEKNEQLKLNWNIRLYPFEEVDITKMKDLKSTIPENSIIINCAAYTAVDKAETEQDLAYAVNADAIKEIANLCVKRHCKLVHISTDFVYGSNDLKDKLVENFVLDPLNVYGASKAEGEENIRVIMKSTDYLILRVAWTFGICGNNFIKKIYEQLVDSNVKALNVVDDQFGKPTSIPLIVQTIYYYLNNQLNSGLYNLTCSGNPCTKYDLAVYIKKFIGSNKQINKCLTKDFEKPGVAQRQKNSILNCQKIYKELSQHINIESWNWQNEINKYLELLKGININEKI